MIEIAILGCGRIGRVHAATLANMDGARLAAICDAVPDAERALSRASGAPARTDEAIMDDPAIHAVVIATPTDTHHDLIERAARAGKAIFCEKPVDMSVARIERLAALVEETGVAFLTAFNRRFDPHFAALHGRLRAGEIGAIETVVITSRDPAPPPLAYIESSGGIFRDMMIHDLDMARFLVGEEFVQVFATGSALVDPAIGAVGDLDTALVTLRTASGRLCQISNSRRAAYGYDQRVEVLGSRGMLSVGNVPETLVVHAAAEGFTSAPTQPFFLERYAEAYRAEMEHFVDCVRCGTKPVPSIIDGLQAQRLAYAATQASDTGTVQNL